MTGSQFAQLLRARRTGRGKWTAKCPSHPDRSPSLSIAEGKRGVLVRCMSAGCETKDILAAVGLTYSDLFYDAITPQVRARTSLQQMKEDLTVQWESARLLVSLEPKRRNYWRAIQRRVWGELQAVRCQIEPLEVYRELRGEQWQRMNLTQRERYLEGAYGELQRTASGIADGQNDFREVRVD